MDHSDVLLATLCYSDIFEYPLTKAQLFRYVVGCESVSHSWKQFNHALENLVVSHKIGHIDEYYFLQGRKKIVAKRKEREKISKKKLAKAKPILMGIAKIPTVLLLGISGSLAMYNADTDADIDVFLITKPATLWITRLFILAFLQTKQIRRKRGAVKAKNTICVNMLIDASHLAFPKRRQNMYSAHEIMQMRPIVSREYVYERFLKENSWILRFLPHAYHKESIKMQSYLHKSTRIVELLSKLFSELEPIAKLVQEWYMRKHRTTETITQGFVAFHPLEYKESVLKQFEKRKQIYLP